MKLHIFDIDETLCKDGDVLSKSTLHILKKIISKNDNIWFASARGWNTIIDALHNDKDLLKGNIATQNGAIILNNTKCNQIHTFSPKEFLDISTLILEEKNNIKFMDFWYDNMLITYNPSNYILNPLEEIYRIYINDLNKMFNFEYISMIHLLSDNDFNFSKDISHSKDFDEYILLPKFVNKSLILSSIPSFISEIHIYGNGNNDFDLFNSKTNIPKILYCVGSNIKLRKISDLFFKNYKFLLNYLSTTL